MAFFLKQYMSQRLGIHVPIDTWVIFVYNPYSELKTNILAFELLLDTR